MRLISVILGLTVLLLLGCSSPSAHKNKTVIGQYKCKIPSMLMHLYYNKIQKRYFLGGKSLVLGSDSFYSLSGCSSLETGTWSIRNDSLILVCHNNKWEKDSLNKVRPLKCSAELASYFIMDDDDGLKKEIKSNATDNPIGKDITIVTWLVRKQ
jgi:hypothetical protein